MKIPPEISREYERIRRLANPERFRENARRRRMRNPELIRKQHRESYQRTKVHHLETCKKWAAKNKEKIKAYYSDYKRKNRSRLNECERIRYHNNLEKARKYERDRKRLRSSKNPNYRLSQALRARLIRALRYKGKKLQSTMQLLGCSIEDLWIYLESKFEEGMTRENYGKVWEVDHIMPCAIFDLSKPEHQKRCFHFSNLQPLIGVDNRRKGAKVLSDQFNLL